MLMAMPFSSARTADREVSYGCPQELLRIEDRLAVLEDRKDRLGCQVLLIIIIAGELPCAGRSDRLQRLDVEKTPSRR